MPLKYYYCRTKGWPNCIYPPYVNSHNRQRQAQGIKHWCAQRCARIYTNGEEVQIPSASERGPSQYDETRLWPRDQPLSSRRNRPSKSRSISSLLNTARDCCRSFIPKIHHSPLQSPAPVHPLSSPGYILLLYVSPIRRP